MIPKLRTPWLRSMSTRLTQGNFTRSQAVVKVPFSTLLSRIVNKRYRWQKKVLVRTLMVGIIRPAMQSTNLKRAKKVQKLSKKTLNCQLQHKESYYTRGTLWLSISRPTRKTQDNIHVQRLSKERWLLMQLKQCMDLIHNQRLLLKWSRRQSWVQSIKSRTWIRWWAVLMFPQQSFQAKKRPRMVAHSSLGQRWIIPWCRQFRIWLLTRSWSFVRRRLTSHKTCRKGSTSWHSLSLANRLTSLPLRVLWKVLWLTSQAAMRSLRISKIRWLHHLMKRMQSCISKTIACWC